MGQKKKKPKKECFRKSLVFLLVSMLTFPLIPTTGFSESTHDLSTISKQKTYKCTINENGSILENEKSTIPNKVTPVNIEESEDDKKKDKNKEEPKNYEVKPTAKVESTSNVTPVTIGFQLSFLKLGFSLECWPTEENHSTPDQTPPISSHTKSNPESTTTAKEKAGQNVKVPGDLLDLKDWYLTLPSGDKGDPENIQQPELQTFTNDKYFHLTEERDGIVFRAPVGGVTTKNSNYPRSELREMSGKEKASWSNKSGRHVLELTQAITEKPVAKPDVVTAQIHGGDDDVMQIKLVGNSLGVYYNDGKKHEVIDPNYQLGKKYNLKIVAENGRIIVTYNGGNDEKKIELEESGSSWYFKVGAYTQSNEKKGDKPGAVGEVVVYKMKLEHS